VSVLSAPSADVISVDSRCQHSVGESDSVTNGTPESVTSSEHAKTMDGNGENEPAEIVTKDETSSSTEQKSTGDDVKEDKGGNKNELALAYANRFC